MVVVIIGGETDDGLGAREDYAKVAALGDFFHIAHFTLVARFEPIIEGFEVFGVDFGGGKSDEVEAEGMGEGGDFF